MEKTKHTMGPWDTQNKGNITGPSARHEVVEGINKDGSKYLPTICRMPGLSDKDYANARLIAAAPDLLNACKETLARLLKMRVPPVGLDKGRYYSSVSLLGAAIARAEGRE